LEIRHRSGAQNLVANHLSQIERVTDANSPIRDDFPDDHLNILYSISDSFSNPWFANIVNYLVASVFPPLASKAQKDKIKNDAKHFIWDDPYLWKLCSDQVIRRCILDHETDSILQFCHSFAPGGHLGVQGQLAKCLIVVFIGPPSLKMRGRSAALVSSVREQEIHLHGDNKCLSNLCYSMRCLMFGV